MESTLIPPSPSDPEIEEKEIQASQVYPWARHMLLMVLVVLALTIILSLIYINGKNIYEYGL